jgi:alpha-1,2-mannosyltransferase
MIDLQVLNWGGELVRHQPGLLYISRFGGLLPFFYPPFSGLGFAALSSLPFGTLKIIESVTVILSTYMTIWLSLGMVSRHYSAPIDLKWRWAATAALGAAALWLEPVQETLAFGQLSAVLLLAVVADVAMTDVRWFKGALIGLGAGIKIYPAIFIIYFLLTRRKRAAVVASGTFLVTVAVGYLMLPQLSVHFWSPTGLGSLAKRIDASDLMNQSLNGTIARVSRSSESGEQLWRIAALVTVTAGLLTAAGLYRRFGDMAGMLMVALTSLLASPISWGHYWIWIVPAITWGSYEAWRLRARAGAVLLIVVVALFFAYPEGYSRV